MLYKGAIQYRKNYDSRIIAKAYKDYPNDYRIMYFYMWSLGVDDAEPDLQTARERKNEIEPICDKIIEGCNDVQLCLGAWKMKAILLHAEGRTDEALKIHNDKFGGWYFSSGQMNEQLFTKDRAFAGKGAATELARWSRCGIERCEVRCDAVPPCLRILIGFLRFSPFLSLFQES